MASVSRQLNEFKIDATPRTASYLSRRRCIWGRLGDGLTDMLTTSARPCRMHRSCHPTRDAYASGRKRLGSVIAHCVPKIDDQGGNSVRPCRSTPGSGELNDESEESDISENHPTDAQYPPGNARYTAKPWDSEDFMDFTIDKTVASKATVKSYEELCAGLPRCTVRDVIQGEGLFSSMI